MLRMGQSVINKVNKIKLNCVNKRKGNVAPCSLWLPCKEKVGNRSAWKGNCAYGREKWVQDHRVGFHPRRESSRWERGEMV